MPNPYHLPVPVEISLMQEFRFLPAVGMTEQWVGMTYYPAPAAGPRLGRPRRADSTIATSSIPVMVR